MPSRTAIGSIVISDNLTGLVTDNFLVCDVEHAAQNVPFRFPEQDFDAGEYNDWPIEKKIAMSVRVMQKFQPWYERSRPIEQTMLALVALTDSATFIDRIIEDATEDVLKAHQLPMIDHDESFCYITDYKAATDPYAISNGLNTVVLSQWVTLFEEQARRVLQAPPMSFDRLKFWNHRCQVERKALESRTRRNPYLNYGFTKKEARRAMQRSYNFFDSFFGQNTAREFIRGKPLKIRARYFTWQLEMDPGNFVRLSLNPSDHHCPYFLSLHDHEGQKLADACIVFEDYGVLDQAIALGIWLSTPEGEIDVIRRTNIFNLTDAGIKHDNGLILGFPNVTVPLRARSQAEQDRLALDMVAVRRAVRGMTGAERLEFYRELEHLDDIPFTQGTRACRIDEMVQEPDEVVELEDWGDTDSDSPFDNQEPYWDWQIYRCEYAYQRARLDDQRLADHAVAPLIQRIANSRFDSDRMEQMNIAIEAQRGMIEAQKRDRRRLELNPVSRALREQLYRRLDVRPDLLAYMGEPETPSFHQFSRVWHAPRLEGFISRKEPLDDRNAA